MHKIASSFSGNCCIPNDLRVKPFQSMPRVKTILKLITYHVSCEIWTLFTFSLPADHARRVSEKNCLNKEKGAHWLISRTIACEGNRPIYAFGF